MQKGYITWNDLATKELGGYELEELLNRISGSVAYVEEPLTAPNNTIIVWGQNTDGNLTRKS